MNNLSTSSSSASDAIEETMAKLDQVFKLRGNRATTVDGVVDQLRVRNKTLQSHLSELKAKYTSLEASYTNYVEESESKFATLELRYADDTAALSIELNKLKEELISAQSTMTASKAELDMKSESYQKMEKDLQDALSQHDEMQKIIETLQLGVEDRVKRTASEAERLIHQTKARHEVETRRMNALLREANSKVDGVRVEAERHVEEFRSKFEIERKRNEDLVRERDFMRQENDRLNAIVNSIQGTVDQLLNDEIKITGSIESLKFDLSDDLSENLDTNTSEESLGFIDLGSSIMRAAESEQY